HDVEASKLPAVVAGYNTTLISQIAPTFPNLPKSQHRKTWTCCITARSASFLGQFVVSRACILRYIAQRTQGNMGSILLKVPARSHMLSKLPARTTKSRKRLSKRDWSLLYFLRLKARRVRAFHPSLPCLGLAARSKF